MIDQPSEIKDFFYQHILDLQNEICSSLEAQDGQARFKEDSWERPGGGGGLSRVIENGGVFEKGGVNVSAVHGELPSSMMNKFNVKDARFFACGISLVIHPENPFVPTTHANYRMFELYDDQGKVVRRWFGGGADLTPYYLFKEDARHFHEEMKKALDPHGSHYYPEFKKECDEYFVNHHRDGEMRGVGGIFYDYQEARGEDWKDVLDMHLSASRAFLPSYVPIVERRKDHNYASEHKEWQEIRRGRYVEFNLVHDRGTLFGLKTNGRTESILMSLPPTVRWIYDHHPEPGTPEAELVAHLKPVDWVNS